MDWRGYFVFVSRFRLVVCDCKRGLIMPVETLYVMIGVMVPVALIGAIATILAHLPEKKNK
jgi:hypothetical protein